MFVISALVPRVIRESIGYFPAPKNILTHRLSCLYLYSKILNIISDSLSFQKKTIVDYQERY